MEQWQAGWCTGRSALSFGYTSQDEYLARQLFLNGAGALSASVDMALVTQPATAANSGGASPTERQYTYAPLANSAIAFAYYIDNPNTGAPYTNLVLNARLAAKLLTQSYALEYDCSEPPPAGGRSAKEHNPDTIFDDPEFYALNGGDTAANIAQFPNDSTPYTQYGSFVPTVVAGNSDITYELTGWIASDPAASAFLNGKTVTGTLPGVGATSMAVNKNYQGVTFPEEQFVPLDPGWSVGNLATNLAENNWTESIQASWNPVDSLDAAATALATYQPSADNPAGACDAGNAGSFPDCGSDGKPGGDWDNPGLAGQFLGQDTLTAVVSQSQAAADEFPVFALVNADGKAVEPTNSSILAAVSQMTTNADGITQSPNFTSKDPDAYPLAMVDYAMVPTCGLSSAKASAISAFLTDVATKGQTPGYLPGQLAPGYVPLTSRQLKQLKAAASAVKAQHCVKGGGGGTGGTNGGGTGGTGSTGKGSSGKDGTNPETAAKLGKGAHPAGYAVKDPFTAGLERLILPLLIIMGGLLGLGGPVTYVVGRTGGWAALYQRIGWPSLHQRMGTLPHRLAGLVRGIRVKGS
jgi:hypothetical protein